MSDQRAPEENLDSRPRDDEPGDIEQAVATRSSTAKVVPIRRQRPTTANITASANRRGRQEPGWRRAMTLVSVGKSASF